VSEITNYVLKRVRSITNTRINQEVETLIETLVDIAEEAAPTVIFRTPVVISALIVPIATQHVFGQEGAGKESGRVTRMPPEAHVSEFASTVSRLERDYLLAGRELSRRERGRRTIANIASRALNVLRTARG
jgi:hypothetical protein